jgi:hypothetical protein
MIFHKIVYRVPLDICLGKVFQNVKLLFVLQKHPVLYVMDHGGSESTIGATQRSPYGLHAPLRPWNEHISEIFYVSSILCILKC